MTQSHSIKEERKKKFNILDGSDPILPKPLHRRSLCNLVDLEYFFFLQESGIKLPNQVDPQPKRLESCITSKKCFNTELVKPCAYLGNQVTVSLFSFCFPPKMFFFFFSTCILNITLKVEKDQTRFTLVSLLTSQNLQIEQSCVDFIYPLYCNFR